MLREKQGEDCRKFAHRLQALRRACHDLVNGYMNTTCFGMNLAATYFSSHTTLSVEMQEHVRHSVRRSPKSSCAPSSFQGRVEPLDLINVLILKYYKRGA
ncbi:hypothetical protein CRENBAI_011910 [Crenichthys baileyi]|uniref:Uncharacterized protein n=1 Tax=Crenichthys baileyi TaxID=28760 RepID=A0AAV9SEY2_9TELE